MIRNLNQKAIRFLGRMAVFILLSVSAQEVIRDLGVIRQKRWISWDSEETNRTGFRVYAGSTNGTNLQPLGVVGTNRWPGTSNRSGLNGTFAIAITTLAREVFTNLSGTNLVTVTNDLESGFSEIVIASFKDGVPVPPSNIQLMTVLQYLATNSLPVLPGEYALSGK